MATTFPKWQNFLGGTLDSDHTSSTTTLTSAALAAMVAVAADDYMKIVLDPDGLAGEPEIVYVSVHPAAATTATIVRGQEGTTARAHRQDVPWVHAVVASDISGAWAAYTPAWTSNGTAPALGNGTSVGAFRQEGKTVFFRIDLTFGSTSTFGTGAYRFSLPVSALALTANFGINVSGYAEDNAVAGYLVQAGQYVTATTISLLTHSASAGQSTVLGQTAPFTWGSTDYIRVHGFYESI